MVQAKMTFMDAVLRDESGAAISNEEYQRLDRQYFAQPEDDKETIAQKRQMRNAKIVEKAKKSGRAVITEAPPMAAPQNPAQHGVRETDTGEKVQTGQRDLSGTGWGFVGR
jgi:hypothetical protein